MISPEVSECLRLSNADEGRRRQVAPRVRNQRPGNLNRSNCVAQSSPSLKCHPEPREGSLNIQPRVCCEAPGRPEVVSDPSPPTVFYWGEKGSVLDSRHVARLPTLGLPCFMDVPPNIAEILGLSPIPRSSYELTKKRYYQRCLAARSNPCTHGACLWKLQDQY
jgi:hypothetical protein